MAGELIPGKPGEILIYQTEDGRTRVEVRVEHETVWLTQKQMAELFQKDVRTVSEHISNIFGDAELQPDSVIRNVRTTAADGKQYETQHYSLDVIISVGCRVKSLCGTQFRIWATRRLCEYIVKGFTVARRRVATSAWRIPRTADPRREAPCRHRREPGRPVLVDGRLRAVVRQGKEAFQASAG